MKKSPALRALATALSLFAGSLVAHATTYNITDQATFDAAAAVVNPGDEIVVAGGIYSTLYLNIARGGSSTAEVVVRASTPGAVTLTGNSRVRIAAPYIVVRGFRFEDCGPTDYTNVVLFTGADYSRLTQSYFLRCGKYKWAHIVKLTGDTDYAQVDHNTWVDIKGQGLGIDDGAGCQYNHFHHNHFNGAALANDGNGNEPIQLGQGKAGTEALNTLVEYNLIEGLFAPYADPELISVKTGGNTIRYNTFRNNSNTSTLACELTLRYATNCTVEGNFIFGGGIRVYGSGHKVINNYIINGRRAINLPGADDVDYPAINNVLVANNTIIEPKVAGISLWSNNGSLISNVTIKNNLVIGGVTGSKLYDQASAYTGCSYANNLGYHSLGEDADWGYSTAAIKADPGLVSDGLVYRLPTGTSVAKAAGAAETAVTKDMDGQPRAGALDIGADEYAAAAVVVKPLETSDVGAAWLGGPAVPDGTSGTKIAVPGAQTSASANDGNVPANTVDNTLATRWSGEGDGTWLQFDLGATYTVTHLKVAVHQGDARQTAFHLQLSSDGSTWTDAAGSASRPLVSSGTSLALETFNTPDARGRYARVVGHGNTVNLWNSLTEVEVYGHSPTLTAVADTYGFGGSPTTTYGTATVLGAKDGSGTTYDRVTFLKFDLSKLTFTPATATLMVTTDSSTEAGTLTVNQCLTDSWTEAALNWNNKPAMGTTIASTSLAAGVTTDKSVTVSSYVSSQYSSDATKLVSFALIGNDAILALKSREAGAGSAPTLVLSP